MIAARVASVPAVISATCVAFCPARLNINATIAAPVLCPNSLATEFTFKDAGKTAFKARHIEKGASLSKFLAAVESGLIQTPCSLLINIWTLPPTEARERVVTPLMRAEVFIVTVSDGLTYSLATVDNRD